MKAFVDSVVKAKPRGAKGTYLKKISHQLDHGPGREDRAAAASAHAMRRKENA